MHFLKNQIFQLKELFKGETIKIKTSRRKTAGHTVDKRAN